MLVLNTHTHTLQRERFPSTDAKRFEAFLEFLVSLEIQQRLENSFLESILIHVHLQLLSAIPDELAGETQLMGDSC